MPDGDRVHSRLTRLYQKPYKWLCEGKANSNECAWITMKALKQDIMRKGDLPVMLARYMGKSLELTIEDAGNRGSVDWTALNLEFDGLAQKTRGTHYLKELTLCAAKSVLHDVRYGQEIDTGNASEKILERYMYTLYKSEFKERIPLVIKQDTGIDEVLLNRRIEEMQPDIDATVNKWAKKATKDESVAKLRMPRRPNSKPIDLDEDLLGSIGGGTL
ncbi:MAG: hypothetical protein F6K31_33250 [Symploca sp. SIO2G7]|nr:hypothetical protein [Symploca sp. SIO2G7]